MKSVPQLFTKERVKQIYRELSPPQIDSYELDGKEVKVYAPRTADGYRDQVTQPLNAPRIWQR